MRPWPLVVCLAFPGCTKYNPAYDGPATTDGSASTTDPISLTDPDGPTEPPAPTTDASPTTEAPTGDDDTSAPTDVTTAPVDATTSEPDPTTEVGTTDAPDLTTGGPPLGCEGVAIRLEIGKSGRDDAGTVPASMGMPCPWGGGPGACNDRNFGGTGFFRLVNDPNIVGRSVALLRFDVNDLAEAAQQLGIDFDEIVGVRVGVTVYEEQAAPDPGTELQVHLLSTANSAWSEGTKDAMPGGNNESSANCQTGNLPNCVGWDGGDPLAGATPLAVIPVPSADVDGVPDTYHVPAVSQDIPLQAIQGALYQLPHLDFAITAKSFHELMGDPAFGVKLEEAGDQPDPEFYVVVCDGGGGDDDDGD